MSVNLLLLILGLVLLWFPRQWLRTGKIIGHRRHRSAHSEEPWKRREPGDPRLSFKEFTKVRNYVDLVRGAAGSLAIVGGPLIEGAIFVADATNRGAGKSVLIVKAAILLVGVLIQTIRYERERLNFFATIFYFAGISVALCGPWAALFAFVLVWAVNPMLGNAEAFLSVYAVLLAGFGILFRDTPRVLTLLAFVLCFLPVLLSLLLRRPLVVFTRRATSGTHS